MQTSARPGFLRILAFLFLGSCLAHPAFSSSDASLTELDRVVAEVNGTPILLSDLELERDLGLLTSGERNGAGSLAAFLNRRMIAEEIREFGGFTVPPEELARARSAFLARFPDRGELARRLARWGVDLEEVLRRVDEALTVSLYTESRVRFFVQVLPGEIEEAYAKDPARWGGRALEEAWNDVRDDLAREVFVREVERWMANLRERYRVTVLAPEEAP